VVWFPIGNWWLTSVFLPEKVSRNLLNKMLLGAPQSSAGFFEQKKNFFLLPDIKTKFFLFRTRIQVTVPKVLIWPLM